MDFEGKRSGQIPAFGDWDNANELPITQYFESARQAGLLRYAPALITDQCEPYDTTNARGSGAAYPIHLHAARLVGVPPRKTGVAVNNGQNNRRRCGCPPHVKEQHRIQQVQVKVYDVVDGMQPLPRPRTRSQQLFYNDSSNCNQKKQFPRHYTTAADGHLPNPILTHNRPSTSTTPASTASANVKPVDEDLYKIPPELLLHNSKRKKMLGFFSRCLVPPCKA